MPTAVIQTHDLCYTYACCACTTQSDEGVEMCREAMEALGYSRYDFDEYYRKGDYAMVGQSENAHMDLTDAPPLCFEAKDWHVRLAYALSVLVAIILMAVSGYVPNAVVAFGPSLSRPCRA